MWTLDVAKAPHWEEKVKVRFLSKFLRDVFFRHYFDSSLTAVVRMCEETIPYRLHKKQNLLKQIRSEISLQRIKCYLKISQFCSLKLRQAMFEKFVIMPSAEEDTVLKRPVITFRRAKTPASPALIQIVGHTFHLSTRSLLTMKSWSRSSLQDIEKCKKTIDTLPRLGKSVTFYPENCRRI